MGQPADDCTDAGRDALWAHQRGECGDGPCPYCCEACGGEDVCQTCLGSGHVDGNLDGPDCPECCGDGYCPDCHDDDD